MQREKVLNARQDPSSQISRQILIRDNLGIELIRTFAIMENQALFWLKLDSWEAAPLLLEKRIPTLLPKLPLTSIRPREMTRFSSIDEAADAINYQVNTMEELRRERISADFDDTKGIMPSYTENLRATLLAQLRHWPPGLDELRRRMGTNWTEEDTLRASVLTMSFEMTLILLEFSFKKQIKPEKLYRLNTRFEHINTLARSVLYPLNDQRTARIQRIVLLNCKDTDPDAIFAFYSGLIQPLYVVAVKCTDLEICQEAVELLSESPWREGAWDSAVMANIALKEIKRRVGGFR